MNAFGSRNFLTAALCLSACCLTLGLFGSADLSSDEPILPTATIKGTVFDENGPVAGALVRVQTTQTCAATASDGSFMLLVPDREENLKLTAWAPGYFIGGPVEASPGQEGLAIELHAHQATDNPDYRWLPSTRTGGEGENQGCAECHSSEGTDLGVPLPVDEWLQDAHSRAARNPRFLSLYRGTDLVGNRSRPTLYVHVKDYGTFPFPPDRTADYYGPGFKLDFPDTRGNCAACHAPLTAVNDPYGVDPTAVSGVGLEGINCDFCHKVWGVVLDPVTGMPFENRPGVLSFEFRRPRGEHQFFAGPLDDVAPGEDTYSPLQRKSQFCAPCHFGKFWDTVVYNSFGEWLESPYSNPDTGKTCQDCHMPSVGATHFARPDKGGLKRDPKTIFSHRMPGALDKELLRNAVSLTLRAVRNGGVVTAEVAVENDRTGHHVPTDSPLRQMILLVEAVDGSGAALELVSGPVLPDWCGIGDPAAGYCAGLPGKAFAKILKEEWTHMSPSPSYWNPTRVLSDNRLVAFASDSSTFAFACPESQPCAVEARLIFRRAFIELMETKGWDSPDILMEQERVELPANTPDTSGEQSHRNVDQNSKQPN